MTGHSDRKRRYSFFSTKIYLPLPCSVADVIRPDSFILCNILPAEDGAKLHNAITSARAKGTLYPKLSNKNIILSLVGLFNLNFEMERSNAVFLISNATFSCSSAAFFKGKVSVGVQGVIRLSSVNSPVFCVILSRRTSSTPSSSALKTGEFPKAEVAESKMS